MRAVIPPNTPPLSLSLSPSRAVITTVSPASASSRAISRPMPLLAVKRLCWGWCAQGRSWMGDADDGACARSTIATLTASDHRDVVGRPPLVLLLLLLLLLRHAAVCAKQRALQPAVGFGGAAWFCASVQGPALG